MYADFPNRKCGKNRFGSNLENLKKMSVFKKKSEKTWKSQGKHQKVITPQEKSGIFFCKIKLILFTFK